MAAVKQGIRKHASFFLFTTGIVLIFAAALTSLAGTRGGKPVAAETLDVIAGASTDWVVRASYSCAQQTINDFNNAGNPKSKGVVAVCTPQSVTNQSPCWVCANSLTSNVISGGGDGMGQNFGPQSCGQLSQGTCGVPQPAPIFPMGSSLGMVVPPGAGSCMNTKPQANFFCSAAQVGTDQT